MLYLIVIILAFFIDRLSKLWAADFVAENGPTRLHPLLTIQETYNRGVAFGMFQGIGPIVGWFTILVVGALLIYLIHAPKELWIMRLGLAILIGGALGNLVDRIFVGHVLDFIETPLRSGIFNMADVLIYVGIGLTILGAVLQKSKDEDKKREPTITIVDLEER
jgi:signal peptidase II